MIVKGIISAIHKENGSVDVILPEYGSVVIKQCGLYRNVIDTLNVNDFVLVAVFNNNFTDCIVL